MIRTLAVLLLLCSAASAVAQQNQKEGAFASDVRREREGLSSGCGSLKGVPGCAQTLFTDHPFHIAVGSIAPQNGFAAGAALAYEQNTKSTRLKWDADAVGAGSTAWRAGAYLKIIRTPSKSDIGVVTN